MNDRSVDAQERVLVTYLGNAATNREWFRQMLKVTPPKTNMKGEPIPGISDRTFHRQLKVIVEVRRHAAISGTGLGKIYSIVAGPWAPGPASARPGGVDGLDENGGSSFPDGPVLPSAAAPLSSSPSDDLVAQATRHAWLRPRP
jgi:hypothetical protein